MKTLKYILLLCITVMFLWSCGDSTNDITHVYESADTQDVHADISPVPESTDAFRQTLEKDTEESLVDMTKIERLLDTWAEHYHSIDTHYSENTYKLLMLARMLLTNDTLTASEKMDIITEYNKRSLNIENLSESTRTNEYKVYMLTLFNTYWPYPTRGALYLVLDQIVNDIDADNMIKAKALLQMAKINQRFYNFEQAGELYYKALRTYIEDNKIHEVNWLLDEIYNSQRRINDQDRRIRLLENTISRIKDNSNYDMKVRRLTVELVEAYMVNDKYEYAQALFNTLNPIDKEREDMNYDERLYDIRLRRAHSRLLNKDTTYTLIQSFCADPCIDEIPNIRIDWRELTRTDAAAFHTYFRGLFGELIENEIRR